MTEDQADRQVTQSPLPFAEEVSETGPVTVISGHDLQVRWGHDAQLGLRTRQASDTAVAGGLFRPQVKGSCRVIVAVRKTTRKYLARTALQTCLASDL